MLIMAHMRNRLLASGSPQARGSAPTHRGRMLSTRAQIAIIAAAGGMLLAARRFHLIPENVSVCLFRNLTGIPCPMCGGLTAAQLLLGGKVEHAWTSNPFAVMLILGALAYAVAVLLNRDIIASSQRLARSWVGITAIGVYGSIWLAWWALKTW